MGRGFSLGGLGDLGWLRMGLGWLRMGLGWL
eukprot:gene9192-biopygen12195